MKVIQVPYCFYPDAVGGTEIYVETLSKALQKKGLDIVISAPGNLESKNYLHCGLKVRRFGFSKRLDDLSELYGEGDAKAAIQFAKLLDEEKPDLVHLHAFTRAVSLRLVGEVKRREIPVIFTYHTPTVSCQRGTLMRWGKMVCDGRLKTRLCTSCTLHGLGLPKGVAALFSMMPKNINSVFERVRLSGGLWTAMRMHGLISIHHSVSRAFMDEVDYVIALCNWTREVLLNNGIPDKKIAVIRHGLDNEMLPDGLGEKCLHINNSPLKIVYIGRLNPVKGADVLIRTVKSLSNMPIRLDIYGIIQGETERRCLQRLAKLARGDSRIAFKKEVSKGKVIELLKSYHLLAVPSRWLETGPLTVLEAFAAGIPVIGSNLGGIAELVKDGVNGIMVETGNVKHWSEVIKKCCKDRRFLKKLHSGVRKPNSIDYVAEKIKTLYELFRKSRD